MESVRHSLCGPRRLVAAALTAACVWFPPAVAASSSEEGRKLYELHCASCHGAGGDGEGPAAYLLYPKPRNFLEATYRLRSTPSGALPLDEDLTRTVRMGLAGTAMPAFGDLLTPDQIALLVAEIKSLSPAFESAERADPVPIPPAPQETHELVASGRKVYEKLGCASCHGAEGRGDGPASASLRDSNGYPLPARDFTRGVFKSGSRPEDLYRTLVTGMDGASMPSFAQMLDPASGLFDFDQAGWALVYYLRSLQPSPADRGVGAGARIAVGRVASVSDVQAPDGSGWNGIPQSAVELRPLWTRNEFPRAVRVRAARDDARIAIRLEWDDPSADVAALGPAEFPDKAAISFPTGDGIPFIGMGFRGDGDRSLGGLVNIWCWRADRHELGPRGHFADVQDRYPRVATDWYPFTRGWRPGIQRPAADAVTDHNPTFLTGWGAGNAESDPLVAEGAITEFDAAGFGTLTAQPPREQNVSGASDWKLGRWSVVFVRDLYTGGDGDVPFGARRRLPVAFAVWDGRSGDRNGTKSVTNWHWLEFGEKEAAE